MPLVPIRRPSRDRSRRSGATLVAVLVIVVSMMALGVSFLTVALGSSRAIEASVEDRRAFYLAEAAVAEGLAALRAGSSGNVGTAEVPARLGTGVVWCEATDLGDGRYSIVATGMCGRGRAAVEAVVSVTDSGSELFQAMFLSDDDLSLDSNQLVDSYDSSKGDYESQATNVLDGKTYADDNGNVFSNGSIVVSSNTAIFGDAKPGPDEGISLDSGVLVTGSTTSSKTLFEMPVLDKPDIASMGSLNVSGTQTLGAGSYHYGSLKLKSGSKLIVEGPAEIVSGQFTTSENSTIEIDATNGPVTFYNIGNFKYDAKTTLTTSSGSPADVVFAFDSANKIVFPGGITFLGGIYAPKAPIEIDSNCTFYGAIVAKSIKMSSGTDFHFDEYLLRRTRSSGGGRTVEVLSWDEAPVADKRLRLDRRDPLVVLELDPDDLVSPAEAWQDAPND